MKVPFVDLKAQYLSIKEEIDEAIASVIAECSFIGGKHVNQFEKEFAEAYGMKHCISAGNGTDTLYIILKMLGIGAGDEVITVANSWISSSETITQAGARPVFVDIHPDYFSIDETKIEEKITPETKAIVLVHLQGQACAIDEIKSICESNNLYLIEDCAQSHFSRYKEEFVGTFGDAASFSFYPGKNLGAYGDAGCILINNDALAEKCRSFARHGALVKHQHKMEGINSRMDGLQAAILCQKLGYIHSWNEKRLSHALNYNRLLQDVSQVAVPKIRQETTHTFHLYVVKAQERDALMKYLKEHEIETAIHYPMALPFLEAYKYLNHSPSDFPVAYSLQGQILSLPLFPELTTEQTVYVAKTIREFYNQ